MKLLFTCAWLKRKIESDPDNAEYEAGSSHYDAPRFFIDHGVIHDRKTGKHVRTCNCVHPLEDGIEDAVALLNSLARKPSP